MINSNIARNYAFCLFSSIKSDMQRDKVLEQISLFYEVLLNSKELNILFTSPIVLKKDKLELIENLVKKLKLTEMISNFLKVMIKNSRLKILESVINEYSRLLNTAKGIKLVVLEFAILPNCEILDIIKNYLENKLNQTIKFRIRSNPALIAGVIIKYDSLLYDYSLAGSVNKITRLLKFGKV